MNDLLINAIVSNSSENNLEIDIIRFASFRKRELELLHNDSFLSKDVKHKSLFQLLPRHMRRRTMGYLRKRLPHRIRKAANIKPPSKVNKRPSRKYRRRPSNLLDEYKRRKRKTNMWLETHIWHAKRFHMSDPLYGYRLPLFDNCKCKRAVFRCLKQHCCIHDESYYVCHQLNGPIADLLKGLAMVCSQQTGLTFGAKMYLSGQYEGKTLFYESNKYPFNCIGPVRFLWKQEDYHQAENTKRTLWIWSHPSIHQQVENELKEIFSLNEEDPVEVSAPAIKKRKLESSVSFKSLKDRLVRFKLLGPFATTILANILKNAEIDSKNESQLGFYKKQADVWNKLKFSVKESSHIMPSTVISLLVNDPRLMLPKKKSFNKVKEQSDQIHSKNQFIQELKDEMRKNNLSKSCLWNPDFIKELNKNKKTTNEINKLRSQYLIPGTELTGIDNISKIPILIIQSNSLIDNLTSIGNDMYSGWDLIVPNTWGMAFWLPLIHFGARAIAQKEMNYLLFESGHLQFPNEYFDTKSGQIENELSKNQLYKKFLARPPSKRVNYLKQEFLTPFYLPFKSVLTINQKNLNNDLSDVNFYILRNKNLLNKLSNLFYAKNKQLKFDNILSALNLKEEELNSISDNSYIGVRIKSIGKGTIDTFSLLFSSNQIESNSVESSKNEKIVINKMVNAYRNEALENLKQDKTAAKKSTNINKLLRSKFNKYDLLTMESKFNEFQLDLHDSTSHRTPIGFVCNSGFTLVDGTHTANGFILTKFIIDSINSNKIIKNNSKFDSTRIDYKIPSANLYRQAKIKYFFS